MKWLSYSTKIHLTAQKDVQISEMDVLPHVSMMLEGK